MADENGDFKGAALEESNLANYGSKAHVDARKSAAASEKEFKGAGAKPGLEIWRVENKRTEADTPDFGIKRWRECAGFLTPRIVALTRPHAAVHAYLYLRAQPRRTLAPFTRAIRTLCSTRTR